VITIFVPVQLVMLAFSLMNNSDVIRWSLDLRWQRADHDVGFYDLKQGVRMRSSTDPNLVIDWDSFNAVTRHDRHKQGPDTAWHATTQVITSDINAFLWGSWVGWNFIWRKIGTDSLTFFALIFFIQGDCPVLPGSTPLVMTKSEQPFRYVMC